MGKLRDLSFTRRYSKDYNRELKGQYGKTLKRDLGPVIGLGSSEILRPGELQHMSAGSGVRHSEMNPSAAEPFHMLQIWLLSNETGIAPRYEQKRFKGQSAPNQLHLLAGKDGRDDSFVLHSDAELLAATLTPGAKVEHAFRGGYGWLQVARGTVEVCGATLKAGDGLQLEAEKAIAVSSKDGGEFLLFDLD
jgi:redox-sensitive bicupin YhaK (pirin superfamily)